MRIPTCHHEFDKLGGKCRLCGDLQNEFILGPYDVPKKERKMVRCKFQLSEVRTFSGGTQEFTFEANYDITIPEDQRFAKASPSGKFVIYVDNPLAQAQFKVGEYYYFDATPVVAG
jgi:hypothetical protein